MHSGDKSTIWGQVIAWLTTIASTWSLSDVGTVVGIFSSLAMLWIVSHNQNKRTRLLEESLKRRDTVAGEIPNETQFNSD